LTKYRKFLDIEYGNGNGFTIKSDVRGMITTNNDKLNLKLVRSRWDTDTGRGKLPNQPESQGKGKIISKFY